MPNKERIDKIFSDVRKKVAKNANYPAGLKSKFEIDVTSNEETVIITKK
jgi:hypothetical protein